MLRARWNFTISVGCWPTQYIFDVSRIRVSWLAYTSIHFSRRSSSMGPASDRWVKLLTYQIFFENPKSSMGSYFGGSVGSSKICRISDPFFVQPCERKTRKILPWTHTQPGIIIQDRRYPESVCCTQWDSQDAGRTVALTTWTSRGKSHSWSQLASWISPLAPPTPPVLLKYFWV